MIAVGSSKARRDKTEAARYQGSPHHRRPSIPGSHGIHRSPAMGEALPVGGLSKFSGEAGRVPLVERHQIRDEAATSDRESTIGLQRNATSAPFPPHHAWDTRFNRFAPPTEWTHRSQGRPQASSLVHGAAPHSVSSRQHVLPTSGPSRSHGVPISSPRLPRHAAPVPSARPHGSSWTLYNGRSVPPPTLPPGTTGRSWHWNRGPQSHGVEQHYEHTHYSRTPNLTWLTSTRQNTGTAAAPRSSPPPVNTVFVKHSVPAGSKHRIESPPSHPPGKKVKSNLDKLDLLCQATLEIGPMHENPAGCTCPKSKCIALYCDCFKAGRRCSPKSCGCVDCKNTVTESGPDGARTRAIRSILARNPRAFVTAGMSNASRTAAPGEAFCNCIRSRCLKLYCTCFQSGKVCSDSCTCVGCYNTDSDDTGERQLAIQLCLEKRPDAFDTRVREPGLGCACKNNRCVRKYCECFRTGLTCTKRCSCRQCENRSADYDDEDSEEKKFCP